MVGGGIKKVKTATLEERIQRDWTIGKYTLVLQNLRKLPEDIALETLAVISDAVPLENRLALLERLDPDFPTDGGILTLLGM